ncbi:MAG: DUF4271 domain-containing protein [Bacteroidales bacterium]|nr:DUF4271 domain-containing protein [Bacteroidales bacterium]
MFARHWLGVMQFQWDAVSRPNNWLTVIFCVLLLLFTMIVITFRRKLLLVVRALFSQRHFSLVQREGKVLEDRSSLFVLVFDLLTITTGLVMFCSTYMPVQMAKLPFIAWIGIFFVLVLTAYLSKLLCNGLYARLFGRDKERVAVNQYKFIFMTDFAILLFPLLLTIQYTGLRYIYYIVVVVLAVLFAVWLYRLMKINSLEGHRFHFFLYFCTLEILPWMLFLKVMLII